ncbi:hypothetical protein mru_0640 [Methanobrevibacter ruminantium M1]|uniref:Uncharacterized protein n=1 Tax=Methanobrevibacter ruminantium (strain ATCC 35063 / DSM 1093 / JCM 13430 / OCM 146 / M1) TaxID=634498 RepID=D3E1T0_METRM|nr:hypothetical protein [Methanobrevibacter ruminantium]ADC46491.1 hypothetical protein mru_0640 [Methanobrevibacter ruminantium M1]
MDSKKILVILGLTVLAIFLASSVSAGDLISTGGYNPDSLIILEGADFNIPDGFERIEDKSIANQTRNSGVFSSILNREVYGNPKGEEIVISVVDFDNFDANLPILSMICKGCQKKELLGYPGFIGSDGNSTKFSYVFDNKVVSISAPNEDLINQVLVVEDA